MNIPKNLIALALLSLSLLACSNKSTSTSKQEEVYDFRDEKYQDFYSRFMREVERRNLDAITNDSFERPFNESYIERIFEVKPSDDMLFKLHVEPVDLEKIKILGGGYSFSKPEDVKKRYDDLYSKEDERFQYELCDQVYYEENLFCIKDLYFDQVKYYYFTNGILKNNHINQSLSFSCSIYKR